jgi:60 kDa SS-A/Ro ribonucleoprotein
MSKFNTTIQAPTEDTTNLAGGKAFEASAEWKLTSLLLTSFVNSQFYRSEEVQIKDLIAAIEKVDKKFAAQAAVYARRVFGMRSITHILAAELAKHTSGQEWGKSFYNQIVFRPDDMTEILSYFWQKLAKKGVVPNSMKKGFADAFSKFDSYQLGKHRNDGKEVSLVDVVNLVRPKPTTEKATEALAALVKDELRNTNTWESKLSKAGQENSEEEKNVAKANVWRDLLESNALGYLGLLRNLRNIMEQAPEFVPLACEKLTTESWIKNPRNLVFPFQYLVAYKQFASLHTAEARLIKKALSDAIEISCSNVPKFEGETLIVVDNSGSMDSPVAGSEHVMCSELGAIFGMVLAKSNNADLMEFGTNARYINYNLTDSVMEFGENFKRMNRVGHGTDFHSIFKTANKKYSRIIIFSDMQGWVGHYSPMDTFKTYKKQHGANPFLYSFDLHGYGTLQFPENKTILLAGFSEKVLDIMGTVETDKNILINEIKKIDL